jgi:hypothetical protein
VSFSKTSVREHNNKWPPDRQKKRSIIKFDLLKSGEDVIDTNLLDTYTIRYSIFKEIEDSNIFIRFSNDLIEWSEFQEPIKEKRKFRYFQCFFDLKEYIDECRISLEHWV